MGKKRKKKLPSAVDVTVDALSRLATAKLLPGADFDAIQRAERELATAAGLRKRTHRKKTLDQQISEAEARAAAREAAEKKREEARAKKRAAAKKLAAKKKAEKAGKVK